VLSRMLRSYATSAGGYQIVQGLSGLGLQALPDWDLVRGRSSAGLDFRRGGWPLE
jgi:hypothetical protein